MLSKLKKSIYALLVFYFTLLTFFFLFQRNIEYSPRGKVYEISNYDLPNFRTESLVAADGAKLLAWYSSPSSIGQKIILHFHGKGGNLANRAHKLRSFAQNGFGVLAITYRGYPGSSAEKPTESGLLLDANAALKFLFDLGYKPSDIIFFGESLGSGVALKLAATLEKTSQPFAIVLESPFSSIASVAQKKYPFLPVNLILHDDFKSDIFVKKVYAPILIFHGTSDSIVPYEEGQKLFAAINSQKKFVTIQNAGHLNFGDDFLIIEMSKFFNEIK